MERLTGGLKYCMYDGCTEYVHNEDSPDYYPYCDIHKNLNQRHWESMKNRRRMQDEIDVQIANLIEAMT